MIVKFVYGDPKAQPRPRAFARGGKARVYDPGTAEGWKSAIAAEFAAHANLEIPDPIRAVVIFRFARPKSHYGSGKNQERIKKSAPGWHLQKPDIDNLLKAVFDALAAKSGIGVIKDDTQVTTLFALKVWANDKPPGAHIALYTADEQLSYIKDLHYSLEQTIEDNPDA